MQPSNVFSFDFCATGRFRTIEEAQSASLSAYIVACLGGMAVGFLNVWRTDNKEKSDMLSQYQAWAGPLKGRWPRRRPRGSPGSGNSGQCCRLGSLRKPGRLLFNLTTSGLAAKTWPGGAPAETDC